MQSNLTFSCVTCRDLAQSEWADRTLRVAGYWSVETNGLEAMLLKLVQVPTAKTNKKNEKQQ